MTIPPVSTSPPFNITRASHVRYFVKDLTKSLRFYTEVLGFVISDQSAEIGSASRNQPPFQEPPTKPATRCFLSPE